jgi:PAS domain S-box-containing protein
MLLMFKSRAGPRIFLSYLSALFAVVGIGVLAVIQLNRISTTVNDLTNNLAAEKGLADDVVNQILLTRFYAQRYVRTESQVDVDHFHIEFARLEQLFALSESQITNAERKQMLGLVKLTVKAYGETFEQIAALVRERQRIHTEVLDIQEHVIMDRLTALRVHITFVNDPLVFLAFGNAQNAVQVMQLNTDKYLQEGDERYTVQLGMGYQQAQEAFSSLERKLQDAAQRENVAEAQVAADAFYRGTQSIQAGQARLRDLLDDMQNELEPQISQIASEMAASIEQEFKSRNDFSQALIAQAQFVLVFTTLIAVLTGLVLGVVFVRRSVERAQAEETLRESEERYRTLFEGVPIGLYRSTPAGQIVDANPGLVRMLGYSSREALLAVKAFDLYVNPGDRQRWQATIKAEGIVRSFEAQFRRRDEQIIWMRHSSRAVQNDQGRLLYYEGSLEDITERKQAEQALRDAQEQLVRREKLAMLGQLAGSVGHELRNPLSVISNAVYYLKMVLSPGEEGTSSDADGVIQEYLDIISAEIRNSQKIVSDLLDFGRIRPAEREKAAVSTLVAQALKKQPPPEGVQVKTEFPPDLPAVFVDPRQIEMILGNLITNACQAMAAPGSVETPEADKLTIRAQAQQGQVSLSIADTGCGISPQNMEKLFEPLFTTKARGIGLGLAISKNLVQANGGTIIVQSEQGQGSTFTVTLPIKEAQT